MEQSFTEIETRIKEILMKLFSMLKVDVSIEVLEPQAESEKIHVNIKSDSDSLLVGYHGNTLNSIQYLLNIFLSKEFGENALTIVDIGDYRKGRELKLREMARDAANKVKEINRSVSLYPMSSYERRIVHEEVALVGGVKSYSEGEGADRKVIISLLDLESLENSENSENSTQIAD